MQWSSRALLISMASVFTASPLVVPPASAADATPAAASRVEHLRVEPAIIEDSASDFTLRVRYPLISGHADESRINAAIRAYMDAEIAGFMADVKRNRADAFGQDAVGLAWDLSLDYDTPYVSETLIVIPVSGDIYQGGAHGMPMIDVLLFGRDSGQRLRPAELFRPGSPWLEQLATYCYAVLKDQGLGDHDDWLRQGTEANADHYQLLFPQADGLRVVFPPYAVASYAEGPQEVLVPYDVLHDSLDPALFKR